MIPASIKKALAVSNKIKIETEFYDHLKATGLYPHKGQILVLKILFKYMKRHIFLMCGRNFGKSHCMAIAAILYAAINPHSRVYIILPLRAQAHEIYWASSLLATLIPQSFLAGGEDAWNKTELRVTFANGSFLKLDGSDNEQALRGYKPHWLGCDEFQGWRADSYDSMEPNLLAHKAICFKIGTPPDRENHFTKDATYVEKQMKLKNDKYFFMRQPTSANPRISKDELEELRRKYIDRGEEEIFIREYEAIFIPGGASAIFKMFNPDIHVKPRDWMAARLLKDLSKCELWTVIDPGSTTVFAVGFFVLNRYTGEAFMVDEIYEKDDKLTSTGQIWPRVLQKEKELFGKRTPIRYYDEAAAWFLNELCNQFPNDCGVTQTNKSQYERDSQFSADSCSVVKDAFVFKKLFIAEECPNAIEEITNYHKNDKGQIATSQPDHLIDVIRYFFHESHWSSCTGIIQRVTSNERVFYTPKDDISIHKSREDEQYLPDHTNEIDDYEFDEPLI